MSARILPLIATVSLFAQLPSNAPSAADPVIRLDVQQVLVPVIVTDGKGHHVSGLHVSDFRIFEDGAPQEIASFSTDTAASVYDVSALAQPAAGPATQVPSRPGPRRTYVICIDTLHTLPADAARLRETLESLFQSEKGSDAQYALLGIGRQLQVLQTATTNPLAVLIKIRGAGFQAALGGLDASALGTQLNNLKNRMENFCRRCPCGVGSNLRSCGDAETDTLKQSVDADVARWTALSDGLAAQFKSVVEELAKLPTGRTLILVSDGFNLQPRREFYATVAAYLPGSPQFRQQEKKDVEPGLQDALKIAAERNVTIYGIDSRGGYAPSLTSGGIMDASGSGGNQESQSMIRRGGGGIRTTSLQAAPGQAPSALQSPDSAAMEELARATGGVYFHDGKDLLKQFRGALADGREYYLLAYVPKNGAADGRFRRIAVEVTGKNLNVRAKAGYWATRSGQ
jgi:VWFA-related protein